jgi:3-oxoacyl-[acyl-carrier protein] reductase
MKAPAGRIPFGDLSGKQAVITGASSGIGRAIARELAQAGSHVLVHYARSRAAAEQVAEEIHSAGGSAETIGFDFCRGEFDAFANQVWSKMGKVDIWVNNAGADLLTGEDADLSFAEKLDRLWKVDVTGTIQLCRAASERMIQTGSGVILNIGWDQADRGMEGESAQLFSAAKNAIMGFTRSLAVSVAPAVRVNCIAPGWIRTAWGETASAAWQDRVLRETPLQRWGSPQDIAWLARFLVSDEAGYLTGQVINANGGAVR